MTDIKLLYIYIGGSAKATSVQRKVLGQVYGLRHNGIETDAFFFSSKNKDEILQPGIRLVSLPEYKGEHRYFAAQHAAQFHFAFIEDYLAEHAKAYSAIFFRHGGNGPAYESLIKSIADRTFLFVPSNRIRETYCERRYAQRGSLASEFFSWWQYYRFWKAEKRLMRKVFPELKSLVAFTPEFANILFKESKGKAAHIYNRDGVDTAQVPPRTHLHDDGKLVKLIFLKGSASEQKWSGLDRIIESIEAAGQGRFHLYITGNADRQPARYGRDFVTLTGRLSDDELARLINEVDIGVSNLSNHLIHFEETTNLKSRDYYSRGLPFIQSNSMPDVEAHPEAKYYLRLPNDESLLDMDKVYQFAMEMREDKDHPGVMHRFAVRHLDWKVTTADLAEDIRSALA